MIGSLRLWIKTWAPPPIVRALTALRREVRNLLSSTGRAVPNLVNSLVHKYRLIKLRNSIYHINGRVSLNYSNDELVVVCVVRNRQIYINSLIKHYFTLGVKHIVFLDNGSSDNTIKLASTYSNVTVLKTDLPYSKYENVMKDYLVRRFSKGRWNLCVDIDEFFDWPYSRIVRLDSLLHYLNARGYTAVAAQMLDLFSDLPLSQLRDNPDEDITKNYTYYDISN